VTSKERHNDQRSRTCSGTIDRQTIHALGDVQAHWRK